jgi:trk system potassium uptake protein TrkA
MKIVIVGAGEVGFHIAEQLILEKKDVILIEKRAEQAKYASSKLDCIVIQGEGTSLSTLQEADVENADIFIAVTNSDEVNMISCLVVASEFDVPTKIARVRNIEYTQTNIFRKTSIGIDFAVNPEVEAAKSIIKTVEQGATSSVFTFDDMDIQLRDVFIGDESPLIGSSMKDIGRLVPKGLIIAGILRDEEVIIPYGDTVILENDHIFIVGELKAVDKFLNKTGIKKKKLKKILIVGAGKVGSFVAENLSKRGRSVTIIDKDYDTCKNVADAFPHLLVIHGDISDETIFEEEQLEHNDLIITATEDEELNILTAIYAKTRGINRSVALVNKTNYLSMASNLGIDSTISPKMSSANATLKYTRKGRVKNMYNIFDGKAEAIEFTTSESCSINGKPLKELSLPNNSLIVAVQRKHQSYIPDGDFVVKPGDDIIIFAKKDAVEKLESIFED